MGVRITHVSGIDACQFLNGCVDSNTLIKTNKMVYKGTCGAQQALVTEVLWCVPVPRNIVEGKGLKGDKTKFQNNQLSHSYLWILVITI